jgi:hypothetical protein
MHLTRLTHLLRLTGVVALVATATSLHLVSAASLAHPTAKNGTYTNTGTKLTVTIVKHATNTKGSEFMRPGKGKEFEYLYVTIKNAGTKAQEYNEFDFHLVDQKGQSWDTGLVPFDHYSPQFGASQVPGHQTRAGWVGFEISRTTKSVRVMWDKPNTFGDQAQIGLYRLP